MTAARNGDGMHGQPVEFQLSNFGFMHDEEIVDLAKLGHSAATECLITRYRPLIETKARSYFVLGADREDVIQEGMIGLCKAIRDFRVDRIDKFRPFAELCVTRQILSAVKSATRQKHVPLNQSISLHRTGTCAISQALMSDLIRDHRFRIEHLTFSAPYSAQGKSLVLESLSDLEKCVLQCYLDGLSYREISIELACHTKSIDNALQRIKKKIGNLLKESLN